MILFPNCKINLGLDILARRPDGYHDLATVMVGVDWCDILEIVPSKGGDTTLTVTGRAVECAPEKNLVMKAFRALADEISGERDLPGADIFLHKIIPDGAGLGGGSADAAFTLRGLNELFNLGLAPGRLAAVASRLGADCPFFLHDYAALCTGTGTTISPVSIPALAGKWVAIAKPGFSISTARAYAGVVPRRPVVELTEVIGEEIGHWTDRLSNDFEASLRSDFPEIERLKGRMLDNGALYASLSGSGSAVYGIFGSQAQAEEACVAFPECYCHAGRFICQNLNLR